jgi:hypothetical protein
MSKIRLCYSLEMEIYFLDPVGTSYIDRFPKKQVSYLKVETVELPKRRLKRKPRL